MTTDTRTCHLCGEIIPAVGKKCRYCGEYLDPLERPNGRLAARTNELSPETEPRQADDPGSILKNPASSSPFRGLCGWLAAYECLSLFFLLLGGALIVLSFRHHAIRYYVDRQLLFWIAGAASLVLFVLPTFGAAAFFLLLLYRCWDIIQDGQARTRPETAIALLFVPFFGMYWVFVAIYGLAVDMNSYASRHGLVVQPIRPRLALACSLFAAAAIVPGLNVVLLIPFSVLCLFLARNLSETAAQFTDTDRPETETAPRRRLTRAVLALASVCGIWLAATGYYIVRSWPEHPPLLSNVPDRGINWLAVSPDGSWAVTASASLSENAGVSVWDTAGLPESTISIIPLRRFRGEKRYANNATVSPDGRFLAAIVQDQVYSYQHVYPGELIVWDIETGQQRFRVAGGQLGDGALECAAFSPDGNELAAGTINGDLSGDIVIRNAATGEEIRRLKGHRRIVNCLAYSGDGQRIISGSSDRTVRLWDAVTGKEIRKVFEGIGSLCVAFSPDGKYFATSNGTQVLVRSADMDQEDSIFANNQIASMAFSPDGRYLALDDDPVRIWDTAARKIILSLKTRTLNFTPSRLKSNESVVAFSADGRRLFAARDDRLLTWDLDLPAADGRQPSASASAP
jgi:WD40 repeat protein